MLFPASRMINSFFPSEIRHPRPIACRHLHIDVVAKFATMHSISGMSVPATAMPTFTKTWKSPRLNESNNSLRSPEYAASSEKEPERAYLASTPRSTSVFVKSIACTEETQNTSVFIPLHKRNHSSMTPLYNVLSSYFAAKLRWLNSFVPESISTSSSCGAATE